MTEKHPVAVGRQPIFDEVGKMVGYELLFRTPGGHLPADSGLDGAEMSAGTVLSALSLGMLTSGSSLFINVDRSLLLSGYLTSVLPVGAVVEIPWSITPDDAVLAACHALRAAGHQIALDGFRSQAGDEKLFLLADYLKVSVLDADRHDATTVAARCLDGGPTLIAMKVETTVDFDWAQEAGFTLFQGYGMGRPQLVSGNALAVSAGSRLTLLRSLLADEMSLDELEDIVRTEPALTLQLLQIAAAGANAGTRAPIRTIRGALVHAGTVKVQNWLSLLLLHRSGFASAHALEESLMRARIVESLQRLTDPAQAGAAYTAALVSTFAPMLGVAAPEMLRLVPMSPELADAAIHNCGPLGHLILDVADYQDGSLGLTRSGVDIDTLTDAAVEALAWTIAVLHGVDG